MHDANFLSSPWTWQSISLLDLKLFFFSLHNKLCSRVLCMSFSSHYLVEHCMFYRWLGHRLHACTSLPSKHRYFIFLSISIITYSCTGRQSTEVVCWLSNQRRLLRLSSRQCLWTLLRTCNHYEPFVLLVRCLTDSHLLKLRKKLVSIGSTFAAQLGSSLCILRNFFRRTLASAVGRAGVIFLLHHHLITLLLRKFVSSRKQLDNW